MRMYDIIEKKRDGGRLSQEEISYFIKGYCSETIPDYQAAALLMAIFLKGMDKEETSDLTEAMAHSGDVIDLSEIEGIKVDKHSTGGVGDKTTLILGPIVAACGVPVAKMSGKGLGHTGGTIDKLESIPGFRTALAREEFIRNVKDIGLAIAGQTGNLAPADKKLYALRDVTATVNNMSLIASSIMSKKIASGADKILLDVKTGSGAFMKSLDQSLMLAQAMVDIGNRVGRETAAVVTDMDVPLGNAIGNSLEVIEAIETLKVRGPKDLEEVSFELAARMLELAGKGDTQKCRKMVEDAVKSGKALEKLELMIEAQGGNRKVIENYSIFPKTGVEYEFVSRNSGFIESIRTDSLGIASVILGAGRETKESSINHSAGIMLYKKRGMAVEKGDLIAKLYTNERERLDEAVKVMDAAFGYSQEPPVKKPLILAYVDKDKVERYS